MTNAIKTHFKGCKFRVAARNADDPKQASGKDTAYIGVSITTDMGALNFTLCLDGKAVWLDVDKVPALRGMHSPDSMSLMSEDITGKGKLKTLDKTFNEVHTEVTSYIAKLEAYDEYLKQLHGFLTALERG